MSLKAGSRRIGVLAVLATARPPGRGARAGRAAARAGRRRRRTRAGPRARRATTRLPRRRAPTCARPPGRSSRAALPRGPVLEDGTKAFRAGVCVYLPPGYEDEGEALPRPLPPPRRRRRPGRLDQPGRRAGGLRRPPTAPTRARRSSSSRPTAPRDASWFDRLEGGPRNEDVRPATTSSASSTATTARSPTARGRAIAGLSNGGHGATYLARDRARPLQRRRRDVGQHRLAELHRRRGAQQERQPGVVQRPPPAAPREQPRRDRPDAWTSGRAA